MATFTTRTPVDLLAVVPYLLGFHPEESLVVVTFGTEPFHLRVDLPGAAATGPDPEAVREHLTGAVVDALSAHGARAVALLGYSTSAQRLADMLARLGPALREARIESVLALRVASGRYWALPEGPDSVPVAFDLRAHPFTAAQVWRGRIAHESRAALAATLDGLDGPERVAIGLAADRFAESLTEDLGSLLEVPEALRREADWLAGRLARARCCGEALDVEEAGRVLVLCGLDALAEVAWAPMTRAGSEREVAFWRDLLRRAPEELSAGPAALLALAAWLNGHGALAWCALDRCFAVRPDHALAQQVEALLESATSPAVWSPRSAEGLPILASGPIGPEASGPDGHDGTSDRPAQD